MNCNIKWNYNCERGYLCEIPKLGKYMKNVWYNSFQFAGPLLFNSLPRSIRDFHGTQEGFKIIINEFLTKIPDRPATTTLTPQPCDPNTALPSNSITHWIPLLGLHNRRG